MLLLKGLHKFKKFEPPTEHISNRQLLVVLFKSFGLKLQINCPMITIQYE